MSKLITAKEALSRVKSGMSVMLGGFFSTGSPVGLIRELMNCGISDLTIISNDAASEFQNPGAIGNELIRSGMVSKMICTFSGHNVAAQERSAAGLLAIEIVPMGTFAERIRAGGAGLGGILTPTGVGTVVEQGKQIMWLHGKPYLLEEALRADVALLYAGAADEDGNTWLRGNLKNFAIAMSTAADYVVMEAREVLRSGQMDPDTVSIPAPLVDAVVKGGE